MVHLVFCISIWTIIFALLSWRFIVITIKAVNHLKRLHQIPCDKCAYFTGDYRLKCTVNPIGAMSEQAIGCRDFMYDNRQKACNGCSATNLRKNTPKKYSYDAYSANIRG